MPRVTGESPQNSRLPLYQKLYYSALDFRAARDCAWHLLKKGWHASPYERRGSIYMQQSAFVTALVVGYARPFTKSYGWPDLPQEYHPGAQGHQQLHDRLMNLRHQVYAHSDSQHHHVEPVPIGTERIAEIIGEPYRRLTKAECEEFVSMTTGILDRLSPQLKQMRIIIARS